MDYSYLKSWKEKAFQRSSGRGQALSFLFERPVKNNDIVIDLHYHDESSDGQRGITQAFNEASNNGVSIISTTNHDNIKTQDQYYSYKVSDGRYRGEFINGVEVTCRLNGQPIEILVYDYDYKKAKKLIDDFEFPFLNRSFRIQRILDLCDKKIQIANREKLTDRPLSLNDFISVEMPNAKGEIEYIPFSELGLDCFKDIGVKTRDIKQKVIYNGKEYPVNFDYFNAKLFKYIAKSEKGRNYLAQNEIEISEQDAANIKIKNLSVPQTISPQFARFNRFMIQSPGAPFSVSDEQWWPTAEHVCDFAKKSGGVALLAHPYGYPNVKLEPTQMMEMAVEAGVDGIECLHGFNSAKQVETIYDFCKKNNLLISAGSDTHYFYSNQGNRTEIGIAPGVGNIYETEPNPIHEMKISLYNIHYIGSGEYKKEYGLERGE